MSSEVAQQVEHLLSSANNVQLCGVQARTALQAASSNVNRMWSSALQSACFCGAKKGQPLHDEKLQHM